MKKVYQTISDPGKGNCMQAAMASLFELELDQVPNFISFGDRWYSEKYKFIKSMGYRLEDTYYNKHEALHWDPTAKFLKNKHITNIKKHEGINGFFYAVVRSPKFSNDKDRSTTTHAVIVDKNLNIVHSVYHDYDNIKDYPLADKIKHHGIIYVDVINKIK